MCTARSTTLPDFTLRHSLGYLLSNRIRCPKGRVLIYIPLCTPHGGSSSQDGAMRSPRFLINPSLYLPCSQTPAGLFPQTIQRFNAAPAIATTKASALGIFGAQSHGFYSRCLRFTIRSPYTCKTRFRLVVSLYRVRFTTHRVAPRVSNVSKNIIPTRQA